MVGIKQYILSGIFYSVVSKSKVYISVPFFLPMAVYKGHLMLCIFNYCMLHNISHLNTHIHL